MSAPGRDSLSEDSSDDAATMAASSGGTHPNAQSVVPQGPIPSEAIGRRIGKGVSLNIALTVSMRAISFVSQFVLAHYLDAGDFGLNTTAVTITILASTFRDLGLSEWLVQRGLDHYNATISSIFWLCFTVNCLLGLLVALSAPFIAASMGEPQLFKMILCVAAAFPLGTLGTTLAAKLRMELRFQDMLWMTGGSAILRYVGAMGFAAMGFGALSFVLPLPIFALYESLVMRAIVRKPIWKGNARPELWPGFARAAKWNLLGVGSMSILNVGDYSLLAGRMPKEELGYYFFAYQLVAMTGAILATNVGAIMYPALARLKDEPERLTAAAQRSIRALMLLSAPASVGVGVIIQPAEMLVWNGRWAMAVVPILLIAATFPIRACMAASQAVLMGVGRFKRNSLLNMAVGTSLMATAFIVTSPVVYESDLVRKWVSTVGDGQPSHATAVGVSIFISIVRSFACLIAIIVSLRTVNVSPIRTLRLVLPSWLVAVTIGGGCLWLDHAALLHLHPIVRIVLAGTLFGFGFIAAMRLLSPGTMVDALSIMPGRIARPASRILFLPV